ncbi:uncharacterized protein LOC121594236 [Anopheles merus]|uniref:uncharacterized protein LOC121594236 n=1 Tax=Anopheles merus TaxID=30066 RepID=UPI001BE4D77D|nr:uncharacterized protein LOC121594236 [Anopheles merus]
MEQTSNGRDASPLEIPFCEHYKPLIVEEIVLADHPAHLHYGKCSVIGTLSCTNNVLGSLSLPDLPGAMQLPDGACSVELCLDNYSGIVPRGSQVEVTGILKLRDRRTEITTDAGTLRNMLEAADGIVFKQQYEHMKTNCKPYIEVDYIRTISNARELISCNLKSRKLSLLTKMEM